MALHVNRAIGEKTYWLITFGQRRTFSTNVGSILDTTRTSHYIPVTHNCCAIVWVKSFESGLTGIELTTCMIAQYDAIMHIDTDCISAQRCRKMILTKSSKGSQRRAHKGRVSAAITVLAFKRDLPFAIVTLF